MRILYVAYYFPPTPAVAGRRFRQLATTVFAGAEAQFAVTRGDRTATDLPVRVTGVAATDLRTLVGGAGAAQRAVGAAHKSRWAGALRLRQSWPLVWLTDDGGPQYRARAFAAACRLVEREDIDTVFSSFRPWSDHLIARRLKQRYPHLRWIADFRDLPVDPVRRDVWWPALQRWWGRRAVAPADEVWCVSRGQAAQLSGWHPSVRVERNGLLRAPLVGNEPVTAHFTIVYTGSLYPELQTVRPLVDALGALFARGELDPACVRLVYRGKDAETFRRWTRDLPALTLDIGTTIAPAAAQKMQQDARLLLLLTWSAPGYYGVLTAKLWDYLAAGRPVLALVNGPGDPELTEVLADAGAVVGVPQFADVAAIVSDHYRRWQRFGRGGSAPGNPDL